MTTSRCSIGSIFTRFTAQTYGGKILSNYKYKSFQPSIHTVGTRTGGKGSGKRKGIDRFGLNSIMSDELLPDTSRHGSFQRPSEIALLCNFTIFYKP